MAAKAQPRRTPRERMPLKPRAQETPERWSLRCEIFTDMFKLNRVIDTALVANKSGLHEGAQKLIGDMKQQVQDIMRKYR